MEAQAKGIFEILSKQASGFEQLVNAAGKDPQKAVMMMIADKLPELVKTQVEAIKNLKIDKVTVWDSMSSGKDGRGSSTANYFASMLAAIPPLKDLFNQAGLELPDFLNGTVKGPDRIEDKETTQKSISKSNKNDDVNGHGTK